MTIRGNETHVLDDGTEHNAAYCPDGCRIRAGLVRLLAELDSGARFVRETTPVSLVKASDPAPVVVR